MPKAQGQTTLAIVNVPESSIAREADIVLPTFAGPEIGVASTKAFTCQLSVLASLAIAAGRARGALSDAEENAGFARRCWKRRATSSNSSSRSRRSKRSGSRSREARDVLYLGRGVNYPLALEGALKLKEISYIHAEGYAAGEMKHGPIALIDENVPVIVIAPHDALFAKTVSNMQEVMARGGKVVLISDKRGLAEAGAACLGERSKCRTSIRCSRRWSMRCPCSSSPITPRSPKAPMSTSPATSPRA